MVIAAGCFAFGWFVLSGTQEPTPRERWGTVVFYFLPALIWAAGAAGAGSLLLANRE